MSKVFWKSGTFLYPLPVVLVTCGDDKKSNIMTAAWSGIVNTNPALVYVSIRPERYSYDIIANSKEFAINLTNDKLVYATDWCGVKSGRDFNKFKELKLTKVKSKYIKAPIIGESPAAIECKVIEERNYGSHTMFVAEVLSIDVDDNYIDKNGAFDITKCNLITYANGKYFSLGKVLGSFGYSIRKKVKKKR